MASSPDSSNTVDRRQRPFTVQPGAAARARPSPRPVLPQPDAPSSASTRDEPSTSCDRPWPTLPRVIVPTFPGRNRPQGQTKCNADAASPSPRYRMTKRSRNAITAKEKLHWLKMQDSQPDLSNRVLAKLANVQPCQIREWKKMRERLEVASSCRRRLMGHGHKSNYPFMERAVYRQFLKHRSTGVLRSGGRFVSARWHLARHVKTKMGQKLAAEELQAAAQEDDAAEEDAEAAAAEEEGVVLKEGGEAEELNDDEWWRPGRYEGEEYEEFHAEGDSE
ncbi:unnamed protein product [Closterium sp. Yama58-4]|nr:unnamed protein product [Closterium sp. Yama58-4]